ncbi:organic cation/carnitine transporter 3 [Prunus dulcis]|uniref:Organic cation/carnitine transporter 3 n=1 Tax=Prunus dulcis TaxID=3755 RepID=A0A4Y1RMB6_PRUDU|nr:organic cation/carnitine transporter 3 [Prunus dulcis]
MYGYSGYYQIEISLEDQEKTTFTSPFGTFGFRKMSFGLCNALARFQRRMISLFSDMVEKYLEVFMDNITAFWPYPTSQEKKKFVVEVRKFFWDDPYLFKYCPDQVIPLFISLYFTLSPHTPVLSTPHMGSVNTPDNYVTCDHTILSQYLPIRRYNQRHVWGLSTRWITYATSTHHITISPHTPVQPMPRMGSVDTPDNLCHARPQHIITYLPIRRFNQRHVWGLFQSRITYVMRDLHIISQYLPICRYNQHHVWGLSTRRITYATCDHTILSQDLPICQYNQRHVWGLSTRRITYATCDHIILS